MKNFRPIFQINSCPEQKEGVRLSFIFFQTYEMKTAKLISLFSTFLLTVGATAQCLLWTCKRPTDMTEFQGSVGTIYLMVLSPDGKLTASGGSSAWSNDPDSVTAIRIFDTETGQEIRNFAKEHWMVRSIAFSPDGKTLVSGGMKTKGGHIIIGMVSVPLMDSLGQRQIPEDSCTADKSIS